MNTANKITLARIVMIPIFMVVLLWGTSTGIYTALVIFVIASATDFLDGYIARNYNQITDFGKFVDPLADKLLVVAALLIFIEMEYVSSWIAMIIIAREFIVTSLRVVVMSQGKVMAADKWGKIKTFTQMVAICLVMVVTASFKNTQNAQILIDIFMWISAAVTAVSGIIYLAKNWNFIKHAK